MSPQEQKEVGDGHADFTATAGARVLGGHQLQATTTATTLRAGSNGRPTPTDGPFLETKEVLGGYYLLDADDLDEAISLVSRLTEASVDHSGIEIRPIVEQT